MQLTAGLFHDFFAEVYGQEPFPWQQRLASQVCAGEWPAAPIALPTAAGKTGLIDIAVFALACGAPGAGRRIFFVIDRRVVVDAAGERANWLAEHLLAAPATSVAGAVAAQLRRLARDTNAPPLAVSVLRGGTPRDDAWTRSPLQPIVCCSTVDQIGSSLLFRSYGSRSPYDWPIRAGLAANDAVLIVDEVHLSAPFVATARSIQRYRLQNGSSLRMPFTLIEMSATAEDPAAFKETDDDLNNDTLKARWSASKPAKLIEAEPAGGDDKEAAAFEGLVRGVAAEAIGMKARGAGVTGIVVNRVKTAREVFSRLTAEGHQAVLFTGRTRPFDRAALWERWKQRIALSGERTGQPVFVVATQCIEVGANIDFDAMVTEAASLDALEQRFGRLNRGGRAIPAGAAIVVRKDQSKKSEDAVYGEALAAAWQWLKTHANEHQPDAGKARKKRSELVIDMGVLALRRNSPSGEERMRCIAPKAEAPVLLPAHLDRLSQTSPEPGASPDVSVFLHGPDRGAADIQVVWRADLDGAEPHLWADRVALCPPSSPEMLPVPVWAVQGWLSEAANDDVPDVEGSAEKSAPSREIRPVLCWRGSDESFTTSDPADLRPGFTIVVPASYGGCDKYGWNPRSKESVHDIGDQVNLQVRGRIVLRLDEHLARDWVAPDIEPSDAATETIKQRIRALREAGEREAIAEQLQALANERAASPWVRDAAGGLLKDGRRKVVNTLDLGEGATNLAIVASRRSRRDGDDFDQASFEATRTVRVALLEHLQRCAKRALLYATECGLQQKLAATVECAMELHDIGKADPRFQAWLRGTAFAPSEAADLLAKSDVGVRNREAIERARRIARYPPGGRHELQSVALIESRGPDITNDLGKVELDYDLLLHLVAAHHGRCRPFAPVIDDDDPVEVEWECCGRTWSASSRHRLESAASGVCERFWRLTRKFGWYGLAFLETVTRLADHRVSEEEEYDGYARAAQQD